MHYIDIRWGNFSYHPFYQWRELFSPIRALIDDKTPMVQKGLLRYLKEIEALLPKIFPMDTEQLLLFQGNKILKQYQNIPNEEFRDILYSMFFLDINQQVQVLNKYNYDILLQDTTRYIENRNTFNAQEKHDFLMSFYQISNNLDRLASSIMDMYAL